jgi:hypothetical protein
LQVEWDQLVPSRDAVTAKRHWRLLLQKLSKQASEKVRNYMTFSEKVDACAEVFLP